MVSKAEDSTSPDEGHKDAESTVGGLCNAEPTLQDSQEGCESKSHVWYMQCHNAERGNM